jgi:cellulase/cellobiase CelA1
VGQHRKQLGDPEPPTTSCRVAYAVTAKWNTGFTAAVTVTNTGDTAVNGWTLTFDLPAGQRVSQGWSAQWSQSGATVTAKNASWNGALGAATRTTFGYLGNGSPSATTLACAAA